TSRSASGWWRPTVSKMSSNRITASFSYGMISLGISPGSVKEGAARTAASLTWLFARTYNPAPCGATSPSPSVPSEETAHMKTPFQLIVIAALVPVLGGCGKVQAKAAFKDGNKDYKEENYKKAIVDYEKAARLDPSMAEAWFYLGSSHQALYRPGKEGAENKEHIDKAIECFKKSMEVNKADNDRLKKVKMN